MGVLIMIVQLLAGFSFLVFIHEFGHFIAARMFGLRVEKFYLFFDAFKIKLFSFKKNNCEYGIGWLPVGGYVKIAGMVDESLDTDSLKKEAEKWEYRSRPAWQRLIVVSAGIIINFLAALIIFWLIAFFNGETVLPNKNVEGGIVAGKIAKDIGFKTGDTILSINDQPVKYFNEIKNKDVLIGGAKVVVNRNGKNEVIIIPDNFLNQLAEEKISLEDFITPRFPFSISGIISGSKASDIGLTTGDTILFINQQPVKYYDQLYSILHELKGQPIVLSVENKEGLIRHINTIIPENGSLGVAIQSNLAYEHKKYGFFSSIPIGIQKGFDIISLNMSVFAKIFQGDVNPSKVLSGPIGIAKAYGSEFNWLSFWSLTAMISLALAIMNLLPIPGLDGGHILFLLIEMLRGRPISEKVLVNLQMFGMALLLLLMIYVYGSDIWKLIK